MDTNKTTNAAPKSEAPKMDALQKDAPKAEASKPAPQKEAPQPRRGGGSGRGAGGQGRGHGDNKGRSQSRRRGGRRDQREQSEYDQKVVDIARVTRVMAGGKRMRFRACIVIGNRKGKVGVGVAKGIDVTTAIQKALSQAEKSLLSIHIVNETIPHVAEVKFGGAHVLLKPASKGRGVIAGGSTRAVLELAGLKNVVSKMKGSENKINNVYATIKALRSMHTNQHYANLKK